MMMPETNSLLQRYLNGHEEQVWAELMRGTDAEGVPIPATEAEQVASETMRRVRQNLETIIGHLTPAGYQFVAEKGPWVAPPSDTQERITELERLGGLIPIALKAFWEIVGSVDLMPKRVCQSWTYFKGIHIRPYLDPLQVWPMAEVWECYEYAAEDMQTEESVETFSYDYPFSSDPETKAGFGSGLLLSMKLPDAANDTTIYFEDSNTGETFVSYLRRSLRWGGFPGFADVEPHKRPADLIELAQQLLPI